MKKRKPVKQQGEKRREAIMEAAWALFTEKGYAAVSVDEIIRRSGGSKATLYGFFGSKEELFLTIIRSINDRVLHEIEIPEVSAEAPQEALRRISLALTTQILTERPLELYRLAVSESTRFPEVSRLFYEEGPRKTQKMIAEYLRKATESGKMKVKNPLMAAEFLCAMLLVNDHFAISLGCEGLPSKQKIKETVDEAVNVFWAAYGTE